MAAVRTILKVGLLAALLLPAANASAQLFEQPWSFGRGAGFGAGGFGMSNAYRQAILIDKLNGFDSRGQNVLRGPDGVLLEIDREGGQAFPREALPVYVTEPVQMGSGTSIGGFGFGFGDVSGLLFAGRGVGVMAGVVFSMLDTTGGYGLVSLPVGPAAAASIDAWIAMLGELPL